jgi:hypothetical protein
MNWAGYVAPMKQREEYGRFWLGNLKEEDHLEDPGIDGRIILKWIIKKWDGAWAGPIWLKIRTSGGFL